LNSINNNEVATLFYSESSCHINTYYSKLIGHSLKSIVYAAKTTKSMIFCAKIARWEGICLPGASIGCFEREASILKLVENEKCSSIPKLVHYGIDSLLKVPLLITSPVGKFNVGHMRTPILEKRVIVDIIGSVRKAFEVLHKYDLVYWDLHLGNIVVVCEETNKIILVDFNSCQEVNKRPINPTTNSMFGPIGSLLQWNPKFCDDFEALSYVEHHLTFGRLPWKNKKSIQEIIIAKREWLSNKNEKKKHKNQSNNENEGLFKYLNMLALSQ